MIDIKKKYKTRSGLDVRFVSDQGPQDWPIIGFIGDDSKPYTWKQDGAFQPRGQHKYDLIEVKEKKVIYVNVYEDSSICGYKSEPDAWNDRNQKNGRIACVRVEYEEDQFDE